MPFKVIPAGYSSWQGMKQRCTNPNVKQYADYGGRGIKVCDRWINDFKTFISDMGEPTHGLTIDRVDNNGDYTPENCKWSTRKEQQRNRRVTRSVVLDGVEHIAADIAQKYGFKTDTIMARAELGLSFSDVTSMKTTFTLSDTHKAAIREGQIRREREVTHCKKGHLFDESNTSISKEGWRRCRACGRAKSARQRAAKSRD